VIALDTNVVLRLLIEDDPKQTPLAQRLVREALAEGDVCYVSDAALCEIEWVLVSCYDASRADLVLAYDRLFGLPGFQFEDVRELRRVLERFRQSRVEFSDLLLGVRAQGRGARTTYTFDRALARQEGFSLLI
jgi:predicted nucleic-acid-binding protein